MFLNAMLHNTDLRALEGAKFPIADDRQYFPEDFLLRG